VLLLACQHLVTSVMHYCAGANALQQQQRGKGKKRKPTKEQLLADAEAKRARKEAALADPDAKVRPHAPHSGFAHIHVCSHLLTVAKLAPSHGVESTQSSLGLLEAGAFANTDSGPA